MVEGLGKCIIFLKIDLESHPVHDAYVHQKEYEK